MEDSLLHFLLLRLYAQYLPSSLFYCGFMQVRVFDTWLYFDFTKMMFYRSSILLNFGNHHFIIYLGRWAKQPIFIQIKALLQTISNFRRFLEGLEILDHPNELLNFCYGDDEVFLIAALNELVYHLKLQKFSFISRFLNEVEFCLRFNRTTDVWVQNSQSQFVLAYFSQS